MTEINEYKRPDEDGYELWLRYNLIDDAELLETYRQKIQQIVFQPNTPTLQVAYDELLRGLSGLLGQETPTNTGDQSVRTLFCSTNPPEAFDAPFGVDEVGDEGFVISSDANKIVIIANTDIGVLYGVFHFLRLLQTHQALDDLHIVSAPKIKLRMLNHWDNRDGTIERGYAGYSLWDWHKLPHYVEPRYTDYAGS